MVYETILSSASSFLAYLYTDPTAFLVTTIWILIWKGLALWYASRYKQKFWFVVVFLTNTLGVLPILYLAFFSEKAYVRKINVPKVKRPRLKRRSKKTKRSSKSRRRK